MALFIKGFIIGLGKIIPGVSGSLLAIRLNVYEDMIYAINNLFSDLWKNILFLTKLALGILLAIILGSHIIMYFLDHYYYVTMFIFLLLIVSGIPMVLKETTSYYLSIISFLLYISLLFLPQLSLFNNYYFMGFLEAFTTIVPGISGTALFMSFGLYDELLALFSNIYMFEFNKLIPFGIGLLVGGLIIIRFIALCFKHHRGKTYSVVLGLLVGSIISMLLKR